LKKEFSFTQNTTTLKGRLYVFKVTIHTQKIYIYICVRSFSLSHGVARGKVQTKNLSVSACKDDVMKQKRERERERERVAIPI
jgi:hypothetical protein